MLYNTEKFKIGDLVKHHRGLKNRDQTNRAIVIDIHRRARNDEDVIEVVWATVDNTRRLYQSSLELVARP